MLLTGISLFHPLPACLLNGLIVFFSTILKSLDKNVNFLYSVIQSRSIRQGRQEQYNRDCLRRGD